MSNNHSRTLVSQMSAGAAAAAAASPTPTAAAPAPTSDCPSLPATKSGQALELLSRCPDLISRSNLPPLATPPTPPPPSVTLAANSNSSGSTNSNRLPPKKSNHSYINNGFNSSGASSISSSSSLSSGVYRPAAGSLAPLGHRRITMVGDDIILEEEELPATELPAPTMMASKVTKSPIYMNIDSPKRNQSYSANATVKDDALQQVSVQDQDDVSKVLTKPPNPKD